MKQQKISSNKCFTLIELVMVIVILGILSAIALPKFIDLSTNASQASVQGVAGSLASGSAANFAARAVGNINATVLSAANVCTGVLLSPLLQGGVFPTGYTPSGTGDCSGAATAVSCTVTGTNAQTATATIYCAR